MEDSTTTISAASETTNVSTVGDPVNNNDVILEVGHVIYFVFLVFVMIFGTIGNVMTIIAVKIDRKLREAVSNILIVNLALADFLVCGVVVPIVLIHTIQAETFIDNTLCYVSAAISGVACHTAAITMTFIALNRYIAAYRASYYGTIVKKKRVILAAGFCWLFAIANTAPILLAWLEVDYDPTKYVCVCFDGTFPLQYTLGPVFIGHFLPHAITIFCYATILKALSRSRKRLDKGRSTASHVTTTFTSESGPSKINTTDTIVQEKETKSGGIKSWNKHEIQMFKTSLWIIIFFSFCWIPYGILVLLQDLAPIELKKTFSALCLLSFSLNPVIYGVLSRSFRRSYVRMLRRIFFCWKSSNYESSTTRGATSTGKKVPQTRATSSRVSQTHMSSNY